MEEEEDKKEKTHQAVEVIRGRRGAEVHVCTM